MKKTKRDYKTVTEYLSRIPEKERAALERLRKIIKESVPDCEEVISYKMPIFKYHGMFLGFAAFKNHCSLFVMSKAIMSELKDELKSYSTETATIHFTTDKPLPVPLVKKIVKMRVKEKEAKSKNKKK